jgi:hypothetical protein
MARQQFQHVIDLETGGVGERVESGNRLSHPAAPGQVECRARQGGHRQPTHSRWRLVVRIVQLDRRLLVDPTGSVQRSGRQIGRDGSTTRPEKGRDSPVLDRELDAATGVHIGVDTLKARPELVFGHLAGGDSFSADEHALHQQERGGHSGFGCSPIHSPSIQTWVRRNRPVHRAEFWLDAKKRPDAPASGPMSCVSTSCAGSS